MNCPYCGNENTKVNDSRESKDGSSIKRRRECLECEKRFSTVEKILKLDLEVVKSNGEIQEFNIQKIKKSLLKACEKRPITLEEIEELIVKILEDLKKLNSTRIPTFEVGKIVLLNLKEIDEMAFLKFAIVHNNYTSMKDFMNEVEKLNSLNSINYGISINNELNKAEK